MSNWTARNIPDLTGRTAVITGASSGIGEEAAIALAAKGAHVVLAVRDKAKGNATQSRIAASHPGASTTVAIADMADLGSVRAFAAWADKSLPALDILINNAGLGMQPKRATTIDGFERQFGTNHLGHFALTALLVPALLRSAAPRVVAISSIAHRTGALNFDDLQAERSYSGGRAYNQSKLANLMFAQELDRRARAQHSKLVSVAAHPGIAQTGFVAATALPKPITTLFSAAVGVMGQNAAAGALPGLYAATMPDVQGGQYWGPDGLLEFRGRPAPAKVAPRARDRDVGARLWRVSEELTGVHFPALA